MKNNFFNKSNLNKFLIIFVVGFISRFFVGHFYSVNVYLDFLSPVSFLYYSFMSAFIVLVHEFTSYFSFNIIPSFSFISSIKEVLNVFFNTNKATMDINQPYVPENSRIDSKSIKNYVLEKNDKDESKKKLPSGRSSERSSARIEEVRLRREESERILEERLRNGLMTGFDSNMNPHSYSQIGSNNYKPSPMEPRVNVNPPVMEPNVTDYLKNNQNNNYQGNYQNNNNQNNNYQGNDSNNNQGG